MDVSEARQICKDSLCLSFWEAGMALALLSPSATEPAADAPSAGGGDATTTEDPPEGYYAFVESPNATPPR
ncbi:hypothetical protein EVAR_43159_1 [Eumeta japonica]|nr:hypothetical protein EVAR_43159_1 [Eumeta japonica]